MAHNKTNYGLLDSKTPSSALAEGTLLLARAFVSVHQVTFGLVNEALRSRSLSRTVHSCCINMGKLRGGVQKILILVLLSGSLGLVSGFCRLAAGKQVMLQIFGGLGQRFEA